MKSTFFFTIFTSTGRSPLSITCLWICSPQLFISISNNCKRKKHHLKRRTSSSNQLKQISFCIISKLVWVCIVTIENSSKEGMTETQ